MKKILVLVVFFTSLSFNSVNAKESFFDLKKGELEVSCVLVSDDLGYHDGLFVQRGSSPNFELTYSVKSDEFACPPVLEEGEACEIIKDISDLVIVTFPGDGEGSVCDDCMTTEVIEGVVKDGICIDLVN